MLINFCVYLVLFATMALLVTTLMYRSYNLYKTRGAVNAQLEDAYVAQDVFMYDIRQAPVWLKEWTHCDLAKIGWKCKK